VSANGFVIRQVEVKCTGTPGKLEMLPRGGGEGEAVRAAEEGRDKAAWYGVDVDGSLRRGDAVATLARIWDVTDITKRHGRFRKIKAAGDGGRRLAESAFGGLSTQTARTGVNNPNGALARDSLAFVAFSAGLVPGTHREAL
jgi:hypothetical protein